MKNKVTVSRAHRLRKQDFSQVEPKTIYLYKGAGRADDAFCLAEKLMPPSRLCQPFTLPYEPDLMPNEVVPFESFDDMCKWVANGKRLEDLMCSHEQELIPFYDLESGSYATVVGIAHDDDFEGETVFAHPHPRGFTLVETSCECVFPPNTKVWPLGAGDTITIEITEQI